MSELQPVSPWLARKYGALRRIGAARAMRIAVDRACLTLLARIFGFAAWHAQSPTSARPYRCVVAGVVNELKPMSVVEVGCGLGAILSLVVAPDRRGFDIDEGVIRAARFLRAPSITFACGDLSMVPREPIDALILVNWIHEVSPIELERHLLPLLGQTRFLVLDAIDQDNDFGYRYKHDFAFLEGHALRRSVTRAEGEGRSYMVYEVHA